METLKKFDTRAVLFMRAHGISLLRVSLGIVFLWFGALKLAGVSPVREMIGTVYSFFPLNYFLVVLGVWEIAIGIGLVFRRALRVTLVLMWMQMAGTLASLVIAPSLFFVHGNFLMLTTLGEFVIKNIVLITAGVAIGGHELRPEHDEQ